VAVDTALDAAVPFDGEHQAGFGSVAVRWSQLGFGRTSSTSRAQSTPRNLFGFKDSTNNLKAEDLGALREHVWVQPGDGPSWMAGGSYLVARRIRMHIEIWDRTLLAEQEAIVRRVKGSGAPLGQLDEFDEADLHVRGGADGRLTIPTDAHIRLASAESLGGERILRGATTSSTGRTATATSTLACSSCASPATRTGSSCPCSTPCPRRTP